MAKNIYGRLEYERDLSKDVEYEEYLKNGSREMTQKWDNTVEKIRQRKVEALKKKEEQKKAEVRRCLEAVKRHDEETRRERIEYAEKLLQRLKAGPKQLESAYKLSLILNEQEQQRRQQLIEQAVEWIENQKEHIRNYRKRCAQYKESLQNDIKEREKMKHNANQRLAQLEEKELQTNTKQTQEVLEKEHKNVTDRRLDRQNADYLSQYNLKQRRHKDFVKVQNEQQRINCYLEQKSLDEFNQKYQEKLKKKRQFEYRDNLAKKLFDSLPDITKVEEKCYQNAVKDFADKWKEQEYKRNNHIEQLKCERITNHLKEIDAIKQIERKIRQEHDVEKAKRHLNEKIDLVFYRQQYGDRVQRAKQLRKIIKQQIEMSEKSRRDELITSRMETNQAIEAATQKDDKHFFDYANKLVAAAKNKGIPIHPLKKVIDEYTVQNSLLQHSDDLPHMKSQIDIGISLERKYLTK
ncbi:trichohyalin-like [Contarinia nasturtii]|uniref:trichohyalin-like n=1 Tax=Contarinia nasturtii TaxID=265458 RepID=UPI0012D445B6|nr:trichohyalin-like [Contarinia nasturtii]